jgi:hypothetical protein
MAIPTGLSAQLGIKTETTYGTYVAPDRFYEFRSESLTNQIARLESQGLRSGTRVLRSDRWASGQKTVGGNVVMEMATKSFGLWLQHALGAVDTTQPDAVPSPTVYDHTFTPGDLPEGFTTQVGKTSLDGTVNPFSYLGCRIASWSLAAALDQIALFTPVILAQDETLAQALAAASYPAGLELFTFVHGTLDIAGTEQEVRSATVNGNNMQGRRPKLGSQLIKEPLEEGMRQYGGQVDAFFDDLTAYNRFINGTEAALVLLFESGTVIEDAFTFSLQVTANVRFDGETPKVEGPAELKQPLTFKCLDDGTGPDSAISIRYRTSDTTP